MLGMSPQQVQALPQDRPLLHVRTSMKGIHHAAKHGWINLNATGLRNKLLQARLMVGDAGAVDRRSAISETIRSQRALQHDAKLGADAVPLLASCM